MITALIVTGHRTNPFDLEGSFTVHLSSEDFAANLPPQIATSRDFTLTVKAQGPNNPVLEYVLLRRSDGVRFDGRIECRPSLRNHIAASGQFIAPHKPAPVGKLQSSLHWDGAKGVFSATWIVPRVAAALPASEFPGPGLNSAPLYETVGHAGGGEFAGGIARAGDAA